MRCSLTRIDLFSVLTMKTNGTLIDGTQYSTAWSAIVLLSMIIFVASYATGLGNVPWQQGELFGLEGGFISYASVPYGRSRR
jgi:SP family myo-inositol transporter-like MFS transporter 13